MKHEWFRICKKSYADVVKNTTERNEARSVSMLEKCIVSKRLSDCSVLPHKNSYQIRQPIQDIYIRQKILVMFQMVEQIVGPILFVLLLKTLLVARATQVNARFVLPIMSILVPNDPLTPTYE